ncbi:G-protein coupled receptor Mth2-like [Ostrinia furnacalis]|uniref:G-protein coupled receptor Mth2-like n=1 Tax=Ostrinia furnacalis TaxID=93504 RepID=UPI00103BAA2D|nr:G-protein coupled receptor Mth2-like [Ostrinia furnacalis]
MSLLRCILIFSSVFVTGIASSLDYLDCGAKNCIWKCCPFGKHVMHKSKKCISYNETIPHNISMPIYREEEKELQLTNMSFVDQFQLLPNAFQNVSFRKYVYEAIRMNFVVYLDENGVMHIEAPNSYNRWTIDTPDMYCLDYQQNLTDNTFVFGVWATFTGKPPPQPSNFYRGGMMASCVFLILVLVVYLLLPELQNLGGKVLMAYVFCLLCSFICLLIVQSGHLPVLGCVWTTYFTYFFFLSSFCWMNVMSCDIWWTFRGYAKARPIHRRGENFKFLMYCLYAFGVSLAMTVMLGVLNSVNMRWWPAFVTPAIPGKGCFLEDGEKLYYLYMPLLIMIILNWMFFLMTAFNIWRLGRGTAVLDSAAAGTPAAHRQQKQRLLVYLKLSILMGLNWLLEVISSVTPRLLDSIWVIPDTYNLLIGVAIFVIFCCKKKIYDKLRLRLLCLTSFGEHSWTASMRSRSNSTMTETSNISQDGALQISINPKGLTDQKERHFVNN